MTTDPTRLYRIRESSYAADLLIIAIAELDILSWVDEQGAVTLEDICNSFGIKPRPADVLRTYLLSLGLLTLDSDGSVRPSALAADHLVAGSRYDLRAYFASLSERGACGELLRVLRSGEPASWASAPDEGAWAERLDSPEFAASITAAMDARGAYLAPALAEAITDLPATRVLDVGGGSGCYARALVDARPAMWVDVLERPPVDRVAWAALLRTGYTERLGVHSADMFEGLPEGYDLHLFSHVLHDWGEEQVRALTASSFAALPPGGWLVDFDAHLDRDKCGPLPVAEYSVLLMHSTFGKCWSVGELAEIVEAAGFKCLDVRATAGDRSALIAQKPYE